MNYVRFGASPSCQITQGFSTCPNGGFFMFVGNNDFIDFIDSLISMMFNDVQYLIDGKLFIK